MNDCSDSRLALAHVVAYPDAGLTGRQRCRAWLTNPRRATRPGDARWAATLERDLAGTEVALAESGWRWVAAADPEFPLLLAALVDPPLGLFVRGVLPDRPAVAVVGARLASAYGREVADHLGRELAAAGVSVISGMARGVDAAAHRGALAAGGTTVAVWGAGPDRVYPPEHGPLANEIAVAGGLATEYPPGARPLPHHFPERNRLIAGMARIVVVVEADEKSGALSTARLALDEGREVMAVPGSIFSRLSVGPNGLIRAGAAPVLSAGDVLSVLGMSASTQAEEPPPGALASVPAGEAFTIDHLAGLLAQPVARVLEQVLQWELAGWLTREPDGRYRRVTSRAHR